MICELLGLPLADRRKFTAWANGFTRLTGAFSFFTVVPKIFAIKRYMEKRLDAARENGGSGLIAELVRVEKEGGRISRNEMVAMLFLLLLAGHEITTHLISGPFSNSCVTLDYAIGWRRIGGALTSPSRNFCGSFPRCSSRGRASCERTWSLGVSG